MFPPSIDLSPPPTHHDHHHQIFTLKFSTPVKTLLWNNRFNTDIVIQIPTIKDNCNIFIALIQWVLLGNILTTSWQLLLLRHLKTSLLCVFHMLQKSIWTETIIVMDLNQLNQFTYLPTYLPTYLLTYLLTYLPACLPTYLPTCLPTYLPTYLSIYKWVKLNKEIPLL